MWICVFYNVKMRVWWNGYVYLMKRIHVFVYVRIRARWIGPLRLTDCSPCISWVYVGISRILCWHFVECSPRIGNLFETHSRNVRNVLVICMLHIRYAKRGFLRCKSMVFGVQKGGFYIAKTPFLKCNILNKEHGTTKCGIIYKVYCHRILMLNLAEIRCSGIMVWCAFWFLDMANTLQNGV